jgi:hypothetical protein
MATKIIGIVLAVFLVVFAAVSYIGVYADYSDGFRAGNIIKFSKKGYVFKTHEGQLQLGNSNTLWDFSADDTPDVVKQIEEATEGGYRVKVYYHEKYYQLDYRGDTKYMVYKVEKIE